MKEHEEQMEMFSEKEEDRHIALKETLIDKIGQSMANKLPIPVRPEKYFQEFHKRRKRRTKASIYKKAEAFLKSKKASDAINTEEGSPLDETNDVK